MNERVGGALRIYFFSFVSAFGVICQLGWGGMDHSPLSPLFDTVEPKPETSLVIERWEGGGGGYATVRSADFPAAGPPPFPSPHPPTLRSGC